MTPQLHKILIALAKELEASVTEKVTQRLRDSYVQDITAIVSEVLNKTERYVNSNICWITIQDAGIRYKMSRKAVGRMCKLFKEGAFKIDRKWIGKHNMLNEQQFIQSFDKKGRKSKPRFLTRKEAA